MFLFFIRRNCYDYSGDEGEEDDIGVFVGNRGAEGVFPTIHYVQEPILVLFVLVEVGEQHPCRRHGAVNEQEHRRLWRQLHALSQNVQKLSDGNVIRDQKPREWNVERDVLLLIQNRDIASPIPFAYCLRSLGVDGSSLGRASAIFGVAPRPHPVAALILICCTVYYGKSGASCIRCSF